MPALAGNRKMLTVEDFERIPEGTWCQLIEGDIFMSPAPHFFHQDVVANLMEIIRPHVRRNSLGKVYASPVDVYLNERNAFQPDMIFVSTANLHIREKKGFVGAPDLVVEVLSPGNAKQDLTTKRNVYQQAGVRELWYIDPQKRTMEVQRLENSAYTDPVFYNDGDVVATPLLPGLEVELAEVFRSE